MQYNWYDQSHQKYLELLEIYWCFLFLHFCPIFSIVGQYNVWHITSKHDTWTLYLLREKITQMYTSAQIKAGQINFQMLTIFYTIFSMIYFAEGAEGNRALIIDELKLSNFLIGLDLLIARNLHIMEKYKMRAKKTQIKVRIIISLSYF